MKHQSDNIRFPLFRVASADRKDYTDALYANGHHQCELVIEVSKEIKDKAGLWTHVPLTDQERASITLKSVSPGRKRGGLALGWICDEHRNKYDLGLWQRGGVDVLSSREEVGAVDARIEYVKRYLRLELEAPLTPQEFMATMVLDDGTYLVSFSSNTDGHTSKVQVVPQAPYTLAQDELVSVVDEEACHYDQGGRSVDVALYYWEGKNGLRFVDNYGLDTPMDIEDEGEFFQTQFGTRGYFKGGVLLEIPDVPLRLEMIHKNLGGDGRNKSPIVRTLDSYVMCAARVASSMPTLPAQNMRSVWRLRDNFGSSHAFLLEVADDGWGLSLKVLEATITLQHFKIVFPDGGASSSALYSNGRHQCKVFIEVKKVQEMADGSWKEVSLTDAERDSASVTLYSGNPDQPLPLGWHCDRYKNMYDSGLWVRSEEHREPHKVNVRAPLSPFVEAIDRYMRVEASVPIEAIRFMARIVVGENVYTTFTYTGDEYVTIAPTRPYSIKAAELRREADVNAQSDHYCDCDVWYWMPPSGLRFMSSSGLDRPVAMNNEGDYFQTAWALREGSGGRSYRKAGVVISKDIPGLRLRVKDVHQNISGDGTNPFIEFNKHNTIMRAVRMLTGAAFNSGNSNSPWRIFDNYGCEHVYRLEVERSGLELSLKDYQ